MVAKLITVNLSRNADADRLQREFRFAIGRADTQLLKEWGIRSAKRFGAVFVKRITNFAGLLAKLTSATADEILNAMRAAGDNQLGEHLANRGNAAASALLALQQAASKIFSTIAVGLNRNPAETAIQMFSTVVGFYAGSGGNGDGGIPDLDLMAGIGAHRSIFTHSIFAGAFIETAVLSLVDLTEVIHNKLPADHDPFWNKLLKYQKQTGESFVTGASLGIAAHLGIDTTIDGFTPYKDLPISLPMELHETLMGLNAAAEGTYGLHRLFDQHSSPQLNTYRENKGMAITESTSQIPAPTVSRINDKSLKALPPSERLNESASLARQAMKNIHLDVNSLEQVLTTCQTKIDHASQPFRLGVIGEFRSGKSTLINALLGEEVAFVDILEATPIECMFRYGEDRHAVFVYKDGAREVASYAAANEIISERRLDAAWISTVNFVEYFVPSPRLRQFDLWDAPGMGGGSVNQIVADGFLDKLGAALWVFDATLLGKATIAASLHKLKQCGKPVIAVINRIDEFNDSIDEAYELLKKIYPSTFDSAVAISALESFEATERGESSESLEHLWREIERCVGISAEGGEETRIERATMLACDDFGRWVTTVRREVQDMIGLIDHVRENLDASRHKILGHLEGILAEETDHVFRQIEVELSTQVARLNNSSESAANIINFFNDPRAQERITREILERVQEKLNQLWRRFSDQAINLSLAALPVVNIPNLEPTLSDDDIKNQSMEEGVFAGGVSLAVAATIAATTAVTWPAILVAIPIGSLMAWKKRRELERDRSAEDEFAKSMVELRQQFVSRFLPSASIEIEKSLTDSIRQLIASRCREVLGEPEDIKAKQALAELNVLESALCSLNKHDQVDWTAAAVMKLLQNPGTRLDIYTPTLDFSLAPLLQGLPPETMVRLLTTCNETQRKQMTAQVEQAFGIWQGKYKVFCLSMGDGTALPLHQTLLVTTDESLLTDGSLARISDGSLNFKVHPQGRLASQRFFGELWDGWSSVYGEIRRAPIF